MPSQPSGLARQLCSRRPFPLHTRSALSQLFCSSGWNPGRLWAGQKGTKYRDHVETTMETTLCRRRKLRQRQKGFPGDSVKIPRMIQLPALSSHILCVPANSLQSCPTLCDPWTAARQAPLSVGVGLPCPPPGDLPDPGIQPLSLTSPALATGSSPLALPEKAIRILPVVRRGVTMAQL